MGQPHRQSAAEQRVSAVPVLQNTHDVAIGLTKPGARIRFQGGVPIAGQHEAANLGPSPSARCRSKACHLLERQQQPADSGFDMQCPLGISPGSSSRTPVRGDYVYHNKDFYIHDNWKVNSRLTLDIGMRFTPSRSSLRLQAAGSEFLPDQWSRARPRSSRYLDAPAALVPLPARGGGSSKTAHRRSGLVGGDWHDRAEHRTLLNGISSQAMVLRRKTNGAVNGLRSAHRAAYDVTGTQRIVLRGSGRVFYDRLQGIRSSPDRQPADRQGSTVVNSTLQQVAQGTQGYSRPRSCSSTIRRKDRRVDLVERRRADGAAVVFGAGRVVCRHA